MSDAKTEAALDTGVKNRRPSLIAYQVREGKDVTEPVKMELSEPESLRA